MEVVQCAGRMQTGQAPPALTGGSVRLSPWRGRALCSKQWTRLKDMLGMHKYEMVFKLQVGTELVSGGRALCGTWDAAVSCECGLSVSPVVPVQGAEVQARVGVETSRNIAWLHVTAYCHLPCREAGHWLGC